MNVSTRGLPLFSLLCLLSSDGSAQFGPDDYGYVASPQQLLPFFDISTTGTNITAGFGANLDDAGQVIPIGFSLDLYGTVITSIGISTNGYLADDADLTDFTNDCPIASGTTPNRGIYPFWDDLRLTEHGDVYTGILFGLFIVQWDDVGTFDDSSASLTFQVQLIPPPPFGCNEILFVYEDMLDGTGPGFDASGGGATIGVEGGGGLDGLAISCDTTGTIPSSGPPGLLSNGYTITTTSVLTPRFGVPPNPGVLSPGSFPGSGNGGFWTPTVSGALPAPALDFLIISAQPGVNVPMGLGTLLCPISPPLLQINGGAGVPFVVSFPDNCNLFGVELCTQGGSASFGPLQIGLTNGIDIRIGKL